MPYARAMKRLSADQRASELALEELGSRISACTEEMTELKVALYAKFGNAINLDE
jgi:prefoldin subunit 4